jgi:hypothetical protein
MKWRRRELSAGGDDEDLGVVGQGDVSDRLDEGRALHGLVGDDEEMVVGVRHGAHSPLRGS